MEPNLLSNIHHRILLILYCFPAIEGWSEGERIRDGERGWFPSDQAEEIKNARARVANLRKQQRLLQHALDALEQQLWMQG